MGLRSGIWNRLFFKNQVFSQNGGDQSTVAVPLGQKGFTIKQTPLDLFHLQDLIFKNVKGRQDSGEGWEWVALDDQEQRSWCDRLMNLCIDMMQSFLGKFKLDQGMLCCRMIYQLKSTRILWWLTSKTWVAFGYMLLKNIEANKLRIVRYYD